MTPAERTQSQSPRKFEATARRKDEFDADGSVADRLVELALQQYRIGRTETDDAFAVENGGPNVALMFRGSRDALRSALARAYRSKFGKTPSSNALSDALTALQGEAYAAQPEPVYLRVAEHDGEIVIDLGDTTGRAVTVGVDGWQIADRSPVLFRRTAATGRLPEPTRGGELSELRKMLNVTDETWPLTLGWALSAFMPDMPHPILLLGGQQGTGKSTAAKKLVGLIDPSPADLRSPPRDLDTWAVTAAGSWIVAVDNISSIPEWWSDSLCKAVTGDGWVRRKLYTDGELAVISFRRVILLTSIDPGALRGDLGDRVLLVDLEPIDELSRRTERDIDREYEDARPRMIGALLDLVSKVLAELPNVCLDRLPRMADFAGLLAAMDRVLGDGAEKGAFGIYCDQRARIAETVIESDPVALAIQALMEEVSIWEGTAAELLERITPESARPSWPATPQSLGGRIKRLAPALEQAGIELTYPPRSGRRRTFCLARKAADNVVTPVTPVTMPVERGDFDNNAVTGSEWSDRQQYPHVTAKPPQSAEKNGDCDHSDERDKKLQPLSDWGEI